MKESIIENKSIKYGIEIVVLYKNLVRDKKEYILSKQLLRSGTSIGANISEAENAQSRKDFISKIEISQKEVAENIYWLKLLYLSKYIDKPTFNYYHTKAVELIKITKSIAKSTKIKTLTKS